MVTQSRLGSIIETVLNVGSGLLTANIAWHLIVVKLYPELGCESAVDVFYINLIFTAISIIRGYIWRRIFSQIKLSFLWSKL